MPKQLLNDGFKGDVDALSNAITFTIIHPRADLENVKESLEITLKDIELRLRREDSRPENSMDTSQSKSNIEKKLDRG